MIYELDKIDYLRAEKLFTKLKTNAAIESIFNNKNEARLFVDDHDFSTICISVFASDNEREIGIKTFPSFQHKGLAYVTACAYIEECLKNDFIPVWSCFSENEVSVKLAEKLGYKIEANHPIYFAEIGE